MNTGAIYFNKKGGEINDLVVGGDQKTYLDIKYDIFIRHIQVEISSRQLDVRI